MVHVSVVDAGVGAGSQHVDAPMHPATECGVYIGWTRALGGRGPWVDAGLGWTWALGGRGPWVDAGLAHAALRTRPLRLYSGRAGGDRVGAQSTP
jgi:hypothetical protein